MDLFKQKIRRLDALAKVEELSMFEVQLQWMKISEFIEVVEKQKKLLLSQIDLIQLQVRQAIHDDAFLDLQSQLMQQKKMQKFDSQLTAVDEQFELLITQRDAIEDQLSELRSKIKGYERVRDRYKNASIESEQKVSDKEHDGMQVMRAGRAVYG